MLEDRGAKVMAEALLTFGASIPASELLPTLEPEASELVASNAYAFCVAACLDRGTKADIIWTIPYYMKVALGHLDPYTICKMRLEELAALFASLPKKPRYINDAPATTRDLTHLVVNRFNGDASTIWRGRHAAEVKSTFMSIHGVGPGIASMAVLLIEKTFHERFSDLDRPNMDIKPDVHTVRVLYRLAASDARDEQSAIRAARRISPEFPGGIDTPLWEIGRRWCSAFSPRCLECVMNHICPKRI